MSQPYEDLYVASYKEEAVKLSTGGFMLHLSSDLMLHLNSDLKHVKRQYPNLKKTTNEH